MSIDRQEKFWNKDKSKRRSPNHPIVKYVFTKKALTIKKYLPYNFKINSILDCGCGNGYFQTSLSEVFGTDCLGIDNSPEMIRLNPNPKTQLASVTQLPFSDNSFDLVTCSGLLQHLPKTKRIEAFKEMVRVAKSYIYLCESNRNNPLTFLFSLIKPEEWHGLVFNVKYLENFQKSINNIKIITSFNDNLIPPNKTPLWLFPLLKIIDKTFLTHWGFNCNIIFKKLNFK